MNNTHNGYNTPDDVDGPELDEVLPTITSDRKKYFPCDECYKKASAQANGDEEMGIMIYDFLHFEVKH